MERRKVILIEGSVECEIQFKDLKKGNKFRLYEQTGEPAHGGGEWEAFSDAVQDMRGVYFVQVDVRQKKLEEERTVAEIKKVTPRPVGCLAVFEEAGQNGGVFVLGEVPDGTEAEVVEIPKYLEGRPGTTHIARVLDVAKYLVQKGICPSMP